LYVYERHESNGDEQYNFQDDEKFLEEDVNRGRKLCEPSPRLLGLPCKQQKPVSRQALPNISNLPLKRDSHGILTRSGAAGNGLAPQVG
jgi:hypothetical protein